MVERNRAPSQFSVVRGAVLLGVSLLVAVVVVVILSLQAYRQFDRAVGESRAIRDAQQELSDVLQLHVDEETGVRGYAFARQKLFLDPYLRAKASFAGRAAALDRAVAAIDAPPLRGKISEIERLHARWEKEVTARLIAGAAQAESIVLLRRGKSLTDRLRLEVRDARALLSDRLGVVQSNTWRYIDEGIFTGLALVALSAVAGLAFVFWRADVQMRLARERAVVDTLQQAFLTDLHDLPGMRIGSIYSSASRDAAVGGDFFDAMQLGPRCVMVLIGDISGKGTEAAVNTAFAKYSVRTLAHERREPARILAAFNDVFLDSIQDPGLFVALFVAIVDLEEMRVTYASAGLAGAFLSRNGDVKQLDVTGPVIGLDRVGEFESRTLALDRRDRLVLVTDGLTEARDAVGEMLGSAGVIELVCTAPTDPQRCADALALAARRRTRGALRDDLAILVIGFDEPSPVVA